MKTLKFSKAVALSVAFACAGYARAEATTVYALTSDGSGKDKTFATASYWKDYSSGTGTAAPSAPNSSKASNLEFIITNSLIARTSTAAIPAHLTVGTLASPGLIYNKYYTRAVTYSKGLTVVNGSYEAVKLGKGTKDKEGKTSAQIAGKIEVKSPKTAPFVFGGDNKQGVVIAADMTGAEDTGILIGAPKYNWTNYKTITLSGDNSAYLGAIEFGRASYITNIIGSATALGGAPSKVNAESLKFTSRGDTTIVFKSAVGDCQIPATRGIYLNGVEGGSIYPRSFVLNLEEGANVEVLGPLKASGQCSNNRKQLKIEKTGAGTLTLSGAVTLENAKTFNFVVSGGRVVLGSATAITALTKELSNAVWIKSPSAAEYTIKRYTLSKGAGLIVRHKNKAAGTITLDSTCKIAATPINIQLVTDEQGSDAYEVCVMKVPTSVKTLTAADFVAVDVSGERNSPNTTFRVDTADGVQSVYLCRAANNTTKVTK